MKKPFRYLTYIEGIVCPFYNFRIVSLNSKIELNQNNFPGVLEFLNLFLLLNEMVLVALSSGSKFRLTSFSL